MRARVLRDGNHVTCTGLRWWLAARPATGGGLEVETADRVAASWVRVDRDVLALLRAVVRVRIADGAAVDRFADEVSHLADVRRREADPTLAVVRATYPLLATGVGDRLPSVPATLPAHLQPAFRRTRPHEAARLLVGDRATKPVARAVCSLLERDAVPDLFALCVAVGAAPALQPDDLVRLLDAPAPTAGEEADGVGRTPLTARQTAGILGLVGDGDRRRVVRLLHAALADAEDRERLRFVAQHRAARGPTLGDTGSWEQLALLVALDPGDVEGAA